MVGADTGGDGAGHLDVVVAAYLVPELARRDFDAYVRRAHDEQVATQGIVLVTKDARGRARVHETGERAGRRGMWSGVKAGAVLGLLTPLLIPVTATVGAVVGGVFGRLLGRRVVGGIGERLDEALPAGSAGIVAVHEHANAAAVDATLTNAVVTRSARIDRPSVRAVRAGLTEAAAALQP